MKNKKFTLQILLVLIVAGLMTTSCKKDCFNVKGEGPIHTDLHQVKDFSGVDCQLDARVNIIYDSVSEVYVTTYNNYQSLIHLYVDNGILVIDSYKSLDGDEITIDIHMTRLNNINLSGSGKIYTTGRFVSPTLVVQLSGSGTIDFSGDVSTLHTNISGSGKINLNGTAGNAKMNISGSGKLHGYNMQCTNNEATVSGSGTLETYSTDYLKVNISGSGSVYYLGSPLLSTNISGSGDLIHVN